MAASRCHDKIAVLWRNISWRIDHRGSLANQLKPPESTSICPLRAAENSLVQVLLSKFSLFRQGSGKQLEIGFDWDTPSIRHREAKATIKAAIPDFADKAHACQSALQDILVHDSREVFNHDDPDFVFRFANGGTLPIISMGGKSYYCLFFRETDPIGWNIANGASDNVEELLDPIRIIKRELREELIFIEPRAGKDFVVDPPDLMPLKRPEYRIARELWQKRYPSFKFGEFQEVPLTVSWKDGPDFLSVRLGEDEPRTYSDIFLNVNATDFGIEIDKIAHIELPDDVLILDGEVHDNNLLGRPIGLFETHRLEDQVREQASEFLPDRLFYAGRPFPAAVLDDVVQRFSNRLARESLLSDASLNRLKDEESKYDLCPATRQIVERHLRHDAPPPPTGTIARTLFLSHATEDYDFARKLHADLVANGLDCWFAREDMDIGDPIRARMLAEIKKRDKFVVILSKSSIQSSWVEAEVEAALEKAGESDKAVLMPIRLDDEFVNSDRAWVAHIKRLRDVGDFKNWRSKKVYDEMLGRLLRALLK